MVDEQQDEPEGVPGIKFGLIVLGVLLLMGLLFGGLLAWRVASHKGALAKGTPTPSPAPTQVVAPTAMPAPLPTPVPTLPAALVVVEGPSAYSGRYPYLVEYTLTLNRGDAVSVTVLCEGCLWPAGVAPGQVTVARGADGKRVVRAVVLPAQTTRFALAGVSGAECVAWELTPADQPEAKKPFRGICVPR